MEKAQLLYEGKAKRLYKTDEQGVLWVEYKDSATAFNGEKKEEISGKGRLNNQITSLLFEKLKANGIASHFVKQLSDSEQLVREVSIVPIEVVVRNIVAGSMAKRLGLEEGKEIQKPVVEFYLKDDELGDPLITDDHVAMLELATEQEVAVLKDKARKINDVLIGFFQDIGVDLVDFKIEFGRDENGEILLADEISPDTCRLWDKETKQKLDKDVFRRNLGNLTDAYELILSRLGGQN
ncbi:MULTISPECIES: phosphoribosylaminoimidazolesuccinocarboxamide synthase [unclassified Planococcus (in: firmicutes)]|uniref:phosphoribosylaminoimidazolesuccinocarboxamide synthase n=1 Tax=Planococcus TaxID=1372 RepID=UPI000C338227|nr:MULTISPECIES: phosphoribosylaminoimidazolesuccinocarboxamide synthase [unclassified Planococcus (in: firmicutes)]AUD13323.1 phosphoribosylaminoimidazolesuccinocarboxamide synthase [Planococcus sp. MB-3u-03]PKG44593.1 phosphoribosylaminoimidazolesuccinocarboxamide synthase [Planococcus sp. Urea-trap-24]PKG89341.1 phosphoribosylaminoimidazolesuccinocarboxamide synthase [Planococcus sp. Urea-3u-39]PKH39200.1 phosphoribosylaminoimidazolesuccinocarboxamide synthase [Planococcus sp. MB-3u-09]